MSSKLDKSVRQTIQAAVDVAWVQWHALGSVAGGTQKARAMIDPEGLVLLSLALRDEEARLGRVLAWWAKVGSRLLSVQRFKNIAQTFPESAAEGISDLAHAAFSAGDARWRPLAAHKGSLVARPKDLAAPPTPNDPAALMLRLRMAFSVGIKADVLGLLLGQFGARATVLAIARSACYYERAVRRAVEDLAAAGFLEASLTAPITYSANVEAWRSILGFDPDPPVWRGWAPVFAFVAELKEWLPQVHDQSEYVISSRARDLVTRHRALLEQQVRLPDPQRGTSESYTDAFLQGLTELREWMKGVV